MHIIHEHSVYQELLDDSDDEVWDEANEYGGFTGLWEENNDEQERRALELLKEAEKAYKDLAAGSPAEVCACGRVKIRHLVLEML